MNISDADSVSESQISLSSYNIIVENINNWLLFAMKEKKKDEEQINLIEN